MVGTQQRWGNTCLHRWLWLKNVIYHLMGNTCNWYLCRMTSWAGWGMSLLYVATQRKRQLYLDALSQGLEAVWSSSTENWSEWGSSPPAVLVLHHSYHTYATYTTLCILLSVTSGKGLKIQQLESLSRQKRNPHIVAERKIIQAQLKYSKSIWHDFFLITTFGVYRTINKLHTQAARDKMKTEEKVLLA